MSEDILPPGLFIQFFESDQDCILILCVQFEEADDA